MAQFILKRIISSLFTLFLFLTFLFFVAQIIMPGDFASQFAIDPDLDGEEIEDLRRQLGLDLPLWKQYPHGSLISRAVWKIHTPVLLGQNAYTTTRDISMCALPIFCCRITRHKHESSTQ